MNRSDFHNLSRVRLREAQRLLDVGFSDGAYYLAGYSVEFALKACIAKRTQEHDFPDKKLVNDSHTHNLTELLKLAKLTSLLEADPRLEDDWATVRDWSEGSRYQRWGIVDATRMVEAVESESGGILPMDKTALVSFDIENGQRVIDALESDGKAPEVALWAVLPEYEDWRLVVASHSLNRDSLESGYGAINAATRKAGIPFLSKPTVFLRNMDDPFIQSLRDTFGAASDVYGMRLGGQKFGNQYIEDAFVYRIR